ncbi:hypothetical protein [Candidatus Chlamydia corallus]|nr:hypothetical protein [Candidatus Chlamydia corallus]
MLLVIQDSLEYRFLRVWDAFLEIVVDKEKLETLTSFQNHQE